MDTKALPPRASLEQYRHQAKDLLRAARAGDAAAVDRLNRTPRVLRQSQRGHEVSYALADAQFVIAREHGFESWPSFASHLDALAYADAPAARFERAADAVVAGDEETLAHLLSEDPTIARARSPRAHHATLLHYIAANGVEDFRQRTPANAVRIARLLIEHGADVDATADSYGGGPGQTTLNLLVSSIHPARAGLQVPLVETLLDLGGAIEGIDESGSPLLTAIPYHYPDAAQTLADRGARVDTILAAAGLGRDDLVQAFVRHDGTLDQSVRLASVPVPYLRANGRAHLELALIWAAALGHASVVDFLSRRGVDLDARDHQGFTALHWAVVQGQHDVITVLLDRHASVDVVNVYGATPLGAARWASDHIDGVFRTGAFASVDYAAIIVRLVDAGAKS
jgi:ankyrin repeat protein